MQNNGTTCNILNERRLLIRTLILGAAFELPSIFITRVKTQAPRLIPTRKRLYRHKLARSDNCYRP